MALGSKKQMAAVSKVAHGKNSMGKQTFLSVKKSGKRAGF